MLKLSCRAVVRVVFLLLTVSLMTMTAAAQGTSSVRGTIRDAQGSVVPKATITLNNPSINLTRTMQSGPTGNFAFDFVPPGHYLVHIEAPGFKKTTVQAEALVATPTDLNVALEVGASNETVEVTSGSTAVQVNTQDSSLGTTFVTEQITQLPMEARDVRTLLTLQAGVTKDGYVAGARSDQSNITLDGVNINDAETNAIDGPVLRLNSEAVEEFRVNTVTSSASAGRSSGAQIALVTKGGTNEFHGSVFEFHRNTIFNANDWFSNHADPVVPRQKLLRNTFGGALGGPIKKDKAFFFYSYEGRRDASSTPVEARIVPLPSLAQGNVKIPTCLPGSDPCQAGPLVTLTPANIATIFPDTGGVNPASLVALSHGASYGANSNAGDGLNTSGFIFNAPTPAHLNSHVAKVDLNLTHNQTLFVRANVIHDHISDSTDLTNLQWLPDNPVPLRWSHPWGLGVGHTWTISNNLISNFHYGLTRQSYTQTGDTPGNYNYLRLVFYPSNGTRDSSRTTPVHNFVEDLSLAKGNHTFGFGGTVTLVNNGSINYGTAYDTAYANPSGYQSGLINSAVDQFLKENYGYVMSGDAQSATENAITALIGRYNNYTANFTFDHDGNLLPTGTPRVRHFATQGYEMYFQDTWKIKPNLTLTAGLRYSLWRPAYEKNGFEAQPQIPLGQLFANREAGALAGVPFTDLIVVNKSGPANGGPPMYNWDKTVFLPKVALAWSPRSDSGFFSKIFGKNGESVFRGGFAIANDYFGQQIATFFDQRNTLGFSSAQVIPVNTFNVGCGHYVEVGNDIVGDCDSAVGPQFTGFGQDVQSLPLVDVPSSLLFPQQKPTKKFPTGIESSLDSQLVTPKNYAWSATYERQVGHNGLIQVSYLGRLGRHLLAQRDVVTPANLKDPQSGMDWYTAATILEKARQQGVPLSYFETHPIPYFENLFAPLAGDWGFVNSTAAVYDDAKNFYENNDWTDVAIDIDTHTTVGNSVGGYHHAFFQPQYGALTTWSTIGNSTYHALTASYRQRMKDLTVDFNYTYSHSLDDASGLQSVGAYDEGSIILNPFRQRDNYTSSGFDMRHIINVSSVWALPVGHGKAALNNTNTIVNGILGGWQLSNIFRWNTGTPFGAPFDAAAWSTNWENQSYMSHTTPIPVSGCVSRPTDKTEAPKFFGNCLSEAFSSFRPSYPGETGERNYFRSPGYISLDFGLSKSWKVKEQGQVQFRWEVFNATNTQRFGAMDETRSGFGIAAGATDPTPNFSNFTGIQGAPRVMQFGLRIAF
jgi:hypothetical protein